MSQTDDKMVGMGPLIQPLIKLLASVAVMDQYVDVRAGHCCCGADMKHHPDPMECGHSPVDAGEYAFRGLKDEAQRLREALMELEQA